MPPQHDNIDLLSELQSHNAYFDSVVNMIPARLYVAGASGDDAYHPKYRKGQHKESREARNARHKLAKREKFDPEKMETTLQAKKRMKREMEERSDEDDDDGDSNNDPDIEMSDGDGEDENDTGAASPSEKKEGSSKSDNNESYASRIEMLRAKLHAKMAEKRAAAGIASADGDADANAAAAGANVDTSAPALVSKRAARRAEKKKRQEAAKQRNKKKAHTVAEQKRAEKRVVKDLGGSKYNAPSSKSPSSSATAADDLATIDYQSIAGLKPKLQGTFDNKSLAPGKKKKSLEKLLADAERKQARLRELKESGAEEDKEKAKNIEWGEALKVAGGANVRKANDPKLLKKALKRKAKKKAASAKAWNVRLDQAKDAADKRQQIRSHNLESRKLGGAVGANLSSKRIVEQEGKDDEGGDGEKKKEKRRRLGPHSSAGMNRAGFEGKKSGFINGEGTAASAGGKGKK
eukprot:CAMPEP_0183757484 /NCGR_PEP_ID=MMETSP0739-20130205/5784_1 /TAXON_ID=385413 /ORGANISM="Thalassiosira miniscula, Strain CCMP1093" /LENGTH=463 /DNA_ID=CAMNT_0025994945 /DNA_START=112 /DNA_END=1503 /DNA_ORIENTATION=-